MNDASLWENWIEHLPDPVISASNLTFLSTMFIFKEKYYHFYKFMLLVNVNEGIVPDTQRARSGWIFCYFYEI